jgi:type I site-specific restriction endonuclease
MRYAEILKLPFVYASNGRGIVQHDYDTRSTTPARRVSVARRTAEACGSHKLVRRFLLGCPSIETEGASERRFEG